MGLPGVTGITDDMITFDKTGLEHDKNLILFLKTTQENGLKLNKSKLQFKKKEANFLVPYGILLELIQILRKWNPF